MERYESVILFGCGAIPGIPGDHGTGAYIIDHQERKLYTQAEFELLSHPNQQENQEKIISNFTLTIPKVEE